MSVYDRLKRIGGWLLPAACPLCGCQIAPGQDFCADCERALPGIGPACSRCAAPFESPVLSEQTCGRCQQVPPTYTAVHALFRYTAPIDRLIHGAKYAGRLDWAALLGRQLARHVRNRPCSFDALVPVPLHRARLRERGYNQSLELARPLAKDLGLPLLHAVKRVRATSPQTSLSREERIKNVRRAFVANQDVEGLRIGLVDDVMTSGATVDAVARCLMKAGATTVEIVTVARA